MAKNLSKLSHKRQLDCTSLKREKIWENCCSKLLIHSWGFPFRSNQLIFFRAETVCKEWVSPGRSIFDLIFPLAHTVLEISSKNFKNPNFSAHFDFCHWVTIQGELCTSSTSIELPKMIGKPNYLPPRSQNFINI